MFDYLRFLSQITGDATWRRIDDSSFENANQRKSRFVLSDGSVILSIDDKPIYCGPFAANQLELVQ
jgi:hypothetical protein